MLRFWKEILLALLIAASSYLIYDKIVSIGINKGKQEVVEFNKNVDQKIKVLEDFSRVIVIQNENSAKLLRSDMAAILAEAKTKAIFVEKNGKCTLSNEFIDSYNSVIDRANRK